MELEKVFQNKIQALSTLYLTLSCFKTKHSKKQFLFYLKMCTAFSAKRLWWTVFSFASVLQRLCKAATVKLQKFQVRLKTHFFMSSSIIKLYSSVLF